MGAPDGATGSEESGRGSSGWEDSGIRRWDWRRPRGWRVVARERGQIEADVNGRRERRRLGVPPCELGREKSLPEQGRLRVGLKSSAAIANAGPRKVPRGAEQHELQSATDQPGEDEVTHATHHER